MAQQWQSYAQAVVMHAGDGLVSTKMLYNPQLKSAYNFVPAIMGMLLMLVCAKKSKARWRCCSFRPRVRC